MAKQPESSFSVKKAKFLHHGFAHVFGVIMHSFFGYERLIGSHELLESSMKQSYI